MLYCGSLDNVDDFTKKLLFLLDRIEMEEESELAKLRFFIAQEEGFDIRFMQQISNYYN